MLLFTCAVQLGKTSSQLYGIVTILVSVITWAFYILSMLFYFKLPTVLVMVAVLLPAVGVWHIIYYQKKNVKYEEFNVVVANKQYERDLAKPMKGAELWTPMVMALTLLLYSSKDIIGLVINTSPLVPLMYFVFLCLILFMYYIMVIEFRIWILKWMFQRISKT